MLSNIVLKEFKQKILFKPLSKKSPKSKGKGKAKAPIVEEDGASEKTDPKKGSSTKDTELDNGGPA